MPKGLARIEQLAKESKARSDAYSSGEGLNRALILQDGQTCRGRFLEAGSDIWYLYAHDLPKKQGQRYADKVLCLDQPFTDAAVANYVEGSTRCRGCELEGVGRPTRVVINFLRYDEPKLLRDAQGKPVKEGNDYKFDGVEPAVVVCNFSTGIGGRLAFLESQYGAAIDSHVCTIHKTGDKNNPFMIDVVEANKPPEPWEIALFNKKTSPPEAIKSLFPRFKSLPLMSYGDMVRAYSGASVGSGFGDGAQAVPPGNVYGEAMAAGGGVNLGAISR
jgi:hypothetical protein